MTKTRTTLSMLRE